MEQIQIVPKVWGQETIVVNNNLYCGKFLHYDAEAKSSEHLHDEKQETFYGLDGEAELVVEVVTWKGAPFRRKRTVERPTYKLSPENGPVTILPGQKHQMTALTMCMILEVSTPHSDDDVTRFTESERGVV